MITTAVIIWEYDPAEPFAQNDECAVDRRGKEPFQYQCISEVEEHERYTEDTAAEQGRSPIAQAG